MVKMRKEYYPAIAIYAASAALFVGAIIGYVLKLPFATPCLLLGVATHLGASAVLTKIGRALRTSAETDTPDEDDLEVDSCDVTDTDNENDDNNGFQTDDRNETND